MHSYLDNTDGHPGHVKTSIATEGQYHDCHLVTKHIHNQRVHYNNMHTITSTDSTTMAYTYQHIPTACA